MKYDLMIIGGGPAGITASIYAARRKMKFAVISENIGGQTLWTNNVENYTGYQFISGADIAKKFEEHIKQFGINLLSEKVISIEKKSDGIYIKTNKNEYISKTVLIASGRVPRLLNVPGEKEYANKGVAYCATCDGPLYADQDVAVIGGGNSALDAALQLLPIANKIYLIDTADALRADPVMTEKALSSAKVEVINKAKVEKISGEKFVTGITISSDGGAKRDIAVQGIFIEIGSAPAVDFIKEIKKNESGELQVNCKCETSVEGIYSAGDATSVPGKQIIVACGEGAKAVIAIFEYLSKN
ncbi:MAG: FAD-dependent oxidoreductase [Elusimicrobiota bacterium]